VKKRLEDANIDIVLQRRFLQKASEITLIEKSTSGVQSFVRPIFQINSGIVVNKKASESLLAFFLPKVNLC